MKFTIEEIKEEQHKNKVVSSDFTKQLWEHMEHGKEELVETGILWFGESFDMVFTSNREVGIKELEESGFFVLYHGQYNIDTWGVSLKKAHLTKEKTHDAK